MYNTVWDKRRVAFMLKTSSVHLVISVQHWIVMDTDLYVSKLHIKLFWRNVGIDTVGASDAHAVIMEKEPILLGLSREHPI